MGKTCLVTIGAALMLSFTVRSQTSLPTSLPTPSPTASQGNFQIVEPFPENIYAVEFTSAQVTCIAFDPSGVKTPDRILFVRKNAFAIYTNITSDGNLYFTSRIDEIINKAGQKLKKLFVTLHFRNLTLEYDSQIGPLGRYECRAIGLGDLSYVVKHGFSVNVIRRSEMPRVSVSDSRILKDSDEITIFCNISYNSQHFGLKTISWIKDEILVKNTRCPDPGASEPLFVTNGGKYTCVVQVLLRNVKLYNVSAYTMIRYTPMCPEDTSEEVVWSNTSRSGRDLKPCPNGRIGSASRQCSKKGTWERPDLTGCRSLEFNKLKVTMEAIMRGDQSNLSVNQVLLQLANSSRPIISNSGGPKRIHAGDLVTAVDLLLNIAEYNNNNGHVSSTEHVTTFAQVASNLLDERNRKTWEEIEKGDQGSSRALVTAMERYGLGVAATFQESTKPQVVKTKNLFMKIDRVGPNSQVRVEGLNVAFQESSIHLPPGVFSSSQYSHVVTLVYLTLNDVLLLSNDNEDDDEHTLSANTTIISSTVDPKPPDVLNKPVKVVLENKKSILSRYQRRCVFWRPGESATWKANGCTYVPNESNLAVTTCECDHLTVFAALMDPYGLPEAKSHKKALEIISTVGCVISLLAILMTVTVNLFFWRVLGSARVKVLLNLCVAIAFSCAFAIFEGMARDKAGCPVVAALLHYFLLALFSWMLCEGVLHYILIVRVFGGSGSDKVKYFYLLGWGFPAIVVATSLAVTQGQGYGNEEACWLDVGSGLIWAFIGPALLIISVNIVVFALVIYRMMGTVSMQAKTQLEKVKAGVKASAVILPLLGITWLFGLLSFNSDTIVFKYIFAIFNSLQGFMVFLFHCAFNRQINDAIKKGRGEGIVGLPQGRPKKLKTVTPRKDSKKGKQPAQYDDGQQPGGNIFSNVTMELGTSSCQDQEQLTSVSVHYDSADGMVNLSLNKK